VSGSAKALGQVTMNEENTVWKFSMSGTFVFGRGSMAGIGQYAQRLEAKRWLVVTDAILDDLGFAEIIRQSLAEHGMHSVVFGMGSPSRLSRSRKRRRNSDAPHRQME